LNQSSLYIQHSSIAIKQTRCSKIHHCSTRKTLLSFTIFSLYAFVCLLVCCVF